VCFRCGVAAERNMTRFFFEHLWLEEDIVWFLPSPGPPEVPLYCWGPRQAASFRKSWQWRRRVMSGGPRVVSFRKQEVCSCKWPTWRTIFFSICLLQSSTCFEQRCAHHQENQLYQYSIWYVSLCVGDRLGREGSSFPFADTRCCVDTIDSPYDEHEVARNM
jgi:hypothetical protein